MDNKPEFRVIIAGGRDYTDYDRVCRVCNYQLKNKLVNSTVIVVCGMAAGADYLGAQWARSLGLKVEEFPADWKRLGRAAGPIRNQQMADVANGLIAFPGGSGTADMIRRAEAKDLIVRVIK